MQSRAVLARDCILTGGTTVHDLVLGKVYRKTPQAPPTVPSGAVLVPGSRPETGEFAERNGVSLYPPVIVKYRDETTDASTMLAEALRQGRQFLWHPNCKNR